MKRFTEAMTGSCVPRRSRGTLGDVLHSHITVKAGSKGSLAQDMSCMRRTFARIAEHLGVPRWEDVCIESVSIGMLHTVYNKELTTKDCKRREYAVNEQFRVCAQAFRGFGVPDGDNPFAIARMEHIHGARAPMDAGRITRPRRGDDGKVCEKTVVRHKADPALPGFFPVVPGPPVMVRDVQVDREVLEITRAIRVTETALDTCGRK